MMGDGVMMGVATASVASSWSEPDDDDDGANWGESVEALAEGHLAVYAPVGCFTIATKTGPLAIASE